LNQPGHGCLTVTCAFERPQPTAPPDRNFVSLFALLVVASVGSIAIAWLVTDRTALARIRKLGETARRLERGELEARVGDAGRDELGELGRAFDSMASSLQERAAEHERSARELHDRESRLRAIFETAVDGIVTIDVGGRIESANPASARLFGYSSEELLRRSRS
jgi:PAS domain-containing protein